MYDFFRNPQKKKHLREILDFSFNHIKTSLIYLKKKGYRLPLEQANENNALNDLTIDILGALFKNSDNKYSIIFDYFARNGVFTFKEKESEEITYMYLGLLNRFLRQELYKINKQLNPEIEKIKRNLKDILKDSNRYQQDNEYISLLETNNRSAKNNITDEQLKLIIEQAYNTTGSLDHKSWCYNLFLLLDKQLEFRNKIEKSQLIRCFISTASEKMEIHQQDSRFGGGQLYQLIQQVGQEQIEPMLDNIFNIENKKLSKLSSEDIAMLKTGCRELLLEFLTSGLYDKLPQYIYNQLPELDSQQYQKKYKNIVDQTYRTALEKLINIIKNDPTFKQLRDY